MYAAEPGTSLSQCNTKSYIQALLRNREQREAFTQSPASSQKSNYPPSGSLESTALPLTHLEYLNRTQVSNDQNSSEITFPENLDNQNDFNYSQKLFHIDDGNLYSIFSPIQGRSYGMKPSFLRKQKYTVQECNGRGRKSRRKGLKFHNFLPSESVTSEKDNGYLRSKWKVHSECRLREEHGTKQITVSNWSQSVQNPSKGSLNFGKSSSKCNPPPSDIRTNSALKKSATANHTFYDMMTRDADPYNFNLNLQTNLCENGNVFAKESTASMYKARDMVRSIASKKDSLSFVLNSLLDKPETTENHNAIFDATNIPSSKSTYQSQKHRRKPIQTRRIVPYIKYLSIMEENDSVPLDLSSKVLPDGSNNQQAESHGAPDEYSTRASLLSGNTIRKDNTSEYVQNSNMLSFNQITGDLYSNSSQLASLLQSQLTTPLMFVSSQVNSPKIQSNVTVANGQRISKESEKNLAIDSDQIRMKESYLPRCKNRLLMNNSQYDIHNSFIKESHSRIRRRNQRSVIKQKLEDTFRQNGFLVKTKQVSDGEATFCKFRQLRKYTRYYLKSWQQHLPDEVHKMWKGFLPPKTVLPSVSEAPEPANGF